MRRVEELAWSETPRGEISLRRRIEPTLKVEVYEVKLGDEFLMSSLFTVAEIELARLLLGNFFELAGSEEGFDPDEPGRLHDAVLLDIDHTPRHLLHPDHAPFYSVDGLQRLRSHLRPGGVFAMWSDDPPDEDFMALLRQVFDRVEAHVVDFANFLTGGTSSNTVYVAA